jgi:hypothetical protein
MTRTAKVPNLLDEVQKWWKKNRNAKTGKQKGGSNDQPSWNWLLIGILFGIVVCMMVMMGFWMTKENKQKNVTIVNERPQQHQHHIASYSALPPEPKVYPNELPRDQSTLQIASPTRVVDVRGTPVNMRTRGEPPAFQQLGFMLSERNDGLDEPIMLPLFGRPTYAGSNKYEYYAASDKQNMMRIPISVENRSCSTDTGCNELYNNDTVYVDAYKKNFVVNIYDKDAPRYIPYI